MKVIGFETYGDASVLEERDIAVPMQKDKQVLVETLYTAVNVYDVEVRRGDFANEPLTQFYVPGNEVVGRVVAVGQAVTAFSIGDMVIAKTARNGYGEYVVAGQSHTFLKPAHLTTAQAASFSHTAVTAYWAAWLCKSTTGGNGGDFRRFRKRWELCYSISKGNGFTCYCGR